MRGKHRRNQHQHQHQRNIPAHAGKTRGHFLHHRRCTEHPRACGENFENLARLYHIIGTSPRMRGKPRFSGSQGKGVRNIPAHAGKTPAADRINDKPLEHPRACGENGIRMRDESLSGGTSPRMRGKHLEEQVLQPAQRNIPAHAGKT